MNIDNLQHHIEWEEYYNPNFDWNSMKLYIYNNLSLEFLEEFQDKVNWDFVFKYQILSEEIIERFDSIFAQFGYNFPQHTLDRLSEDFIIKYKDKLNWFNLLTSWRIWSSEFKSKCWDKFNDVLTVQTHSQY